MEIDHGTAFVALGLIAAGAALLSLAPAIGVPYPILLVLGGLVLGFLPGMPEFELQPELVFFGVLPPLLYGAAFFTSLRELRANARPIGLLAVGLVVVTTVAVAVVAHLLVPGLGWGPAFVLGAIVSPTDPLAATEIARRLGMPRKLVAIVEGESLVNDGSGLVLYRVAVGAVVGGSFSAWDAGLTFVTSAAGGVAVGLVAGRLIREVRRHLDNPPAEVTISLLSGYAAFLPADLIGVSGILAAVTTGIYMGWHTPELTTPQVRLQGRAVWEIVMYLVDALLFALIGLQLPVIVEEIDHVPAGELLLDAAVVSVAVAAVRFAWVFVLMAAPTALRTGKTWWRGATFVSWAGMRGAVSLAAALALPLTTDDGDAFPSRALVIYLTFTVILATLVVQGLTLPFVIRLLGVHDDGVAEREEAKARIHAAEAALARLEELVGEGWVRDDTAERVRGSYRFRRDRFAERLEHGSDGSVEERSQAFQRLRRELLAAERQAVVQLRRAGVIGDDVLMRVQRDLDLEDQRLDS